MTSQITKNTYLITGATSGIGLALMEGLAERKTSLIGIGRSPERCSHQEGRLGKTYPDSRIKYLVGDLSNQQEIRQLIPQIEHVLDEWNADGLDGLINNAGTFTFWQSLTLEGFETQWAVNHLAPFLLTNLLLPYLRASDKAQIITVSSGSHYGARLNWEDVQGLRRYNPLKAYKNSKLANVLFSSELRRHLESTGSIQVFAADPGLVNTSMGEKDSSSLVKRIWSRRRKKGIPPAQSAAGIIKLLEGDVVESKALYWKHGKPKKPNPFGLNEDHGWRLWEMSAKMTGL